MKSKNSQTTANRYLRRILAAIKEGREVYDFCKSKGEKDEIALMFAKNRVSTIVDTMIVEDQFLDMPFRDVQFIVSSLRLQLSWTAGGSVTDHLIQTAARYLL